MVSLWVEETGENTARPKRVLRCKSQRWIPLPSTPTVARTPANLGWKAKLASPILKGGEDSLRIATVSQVSVRQNLTV
jgi:hypothetical protein